MIKVKEIMTSDPVVVNEDDDLAKVDGIFNQNNYHHLPVIDSEGKLCGLISNTDLERALHGNTLFVPKNKEDYNKTILQASLVNNIMTREVKCIDEDNTLEEAYRLLKESRFRCLPVVSGDKLTGILTNQDIVDHFMGGE